jgi:simple sugar transport system permease protein
LIGSLAVVAIVGFVLNLFGLRANTLIETALLAMTPLALAAVGECVNEKAGVINIGLEGTFLISAVSGVFWAEVLGSGVGGLLFGALTGAIIGLILGVLSVYGRAQQIIAGMGLNILGLGLVPFLLLAIWAFPGIHIFPGELTVPRFPVPTPVGPMSISPVTLIAIGTVVLHVVLYRTLIGLRIRAAGEKPEAIDVLGVKVDRVRLATGVLGGALAGLGGAFMPLAWFGGLVREITAGRGFIALAAVVFAGLQPTLALAAAFIFGFSEALAFTIAVTPGVKEVVPFHFVQMLPYLVTLAALAVAVGGKQFPLALGKPYVRE